MPSPEVGTFVQWFPKGNTLSAPLPALVLAVHAGDMLTLNVCDTSGTWILKDGVWNVSSQALEQNQRLAIMSGAWRATPRRIETPDSPIEQEQPQVRPRKLTPEPVGQK